MQEMKSKKREKLLAKELQKFFNKISHLMLVTKNSQYAPMPDKPALILVMSDKDFNDAKHYDINKTIIDLLDDKYPVLHLKINEETLKVEYSIKDEDSGLHFKLITQDATEPFAEFLKATHYTEKIPMVLLGERKDERFVFDKHIIKNVLLIIDGYYIE